MLKRIYDTALLFKEYLLLALYLLLSIILLAVNSTDQVRAIRGNVLGVAGVLQDVFGFVPNYFALRAENSVLREQNLTLSDEVNRLREAALENVRLRQLVGMRERPAFGYVSAQVVGTQVQALRNSITINAGTDQGVKTGMPVVTDHGLVGRIVSTSSRYAIVQLLLHKDLRASARIQRSRVNGIVRWSGGGTLQFSHVPKTLDVKLGDVVITSEFSSLFPAGIRIGIVTATRQHPGELFQEIAVAPSVDFSRLEEVFVAAVVPDSNRIALERRVKE
ncbi:MAG: rod shape-determining protein MreC [Bacteroidetes bacterium]|nr:rod shape-determining protein MreC [Bacteroidota bacterium]